ALEKWVKPKLEIRLPIRVHRQPPLKLVPHESRIRRKGNPKNHFSAKVVLVDIEDVWGRQTDELPGRSIHGRGSCQFEPTARGGHPSVRQHP
ncbi:hypothetical protein, partial [Novosphingobium sp.]|uniref:hypothetical protein n=1 Tax=Novosphingobium sp. TaxID=1874826 RepID=UPI001AD3AEBE